jgi:poly(A) polymerase
MPDTLDLHPREQLPSSFSLALLIENLQRFFSTRHITCYLVGGSLRDLLLGQQPQDLDLAVPGNALVTARLLADTLGGAYAPLRQEKGVGRVILPATGANMILDIAPLRGNRILDDLSLRDFTINALALRLEEMPLPPERLTSPAWLAQNCLIDPYHGYHDLQSKTLRAVGKTIFRDDPLRLLRAIRIAYRHQFQLARATSTLLRHNALLLSNVAPERIRDELLQIISIPDVTTAAQALEEYHLFPAIFPSLCQNRNTALLHSHDQRSRGNTWRTLSLMARLLRAFQGETKLLNSHEQNILFLPLGLAEGVPSFRQHWQHPQIGQYPPAILLRFAALISDLLYDSNEAISHPHQKDASQSSLQALKRDIQRLTIGHQAAAFIAVLLQQRATPWEVAPRPSKGSGAVWSAARHYFQQYGKHGIDLALFCLVYQLAHLEAWPPDEQWQPRAQTLIKLLEVYYQAYDEVIPPTLIDGEDIQAALGISPGPLIGALLAQARTAQLDGLLHSREEALEFIREQADHTIR